VIIFSNNTVFHPICDSIRPKRCEKAPGGRIDKFFSNSLGMMDCPLYILLKDASIIHKTFHFFRNKQAYVLISILLFCCHVINLSNCFFVAISWKQFKKSSHFVKIMLILGKYFFQISIYSMNLMPRVPVKPSLLYLIMVNQLNSYPIPCHYLCNSFRNNYQTICIAH